MAISTDIHYAKLSELFLDPLNPRLGRNNTGRDVGQDTVLELMKDWTIDELAISFLESGGFWTHEALLVAQEDLYGSKRLVVIEGNRRLAALTYLYNAIHGRPASQKWEEIANSGKASSTLFTKIPYILVGTRKEIESFLGFRHVTGIKEWKPAEKAEYIAKMIDEGMTYIEVMRKIGSKTPTVRQNYICYRLLLQMEDSVDDFPSEQIEERFSVMYLSLRTEGVQTYLKVDPLAEPQNAVAPVPRSRIKAMANYCHWLFGDSETPPLFTDSRQVDNFGRILESSDAVSYLERTKKPSFEVALRMAGGDEPEITKLIAQAADNVELALTKVHVYAKSKKIQQVVERFGADANQLLRVFPGIRDKLAKEYA